PLSADEVGHPRANRFDSPDDVVAGHGHPRDVAKDVPLEKQVAEGDARALDRDAELTRGRRRHGPGLEAEDRGPSGPGDDDSFAAKCSAHAPGLTLGRTAARVHLCNYILRECT